MYITACKETKELVESDFIEASKIEEDIIQKNQFYQVYKDFLKSTDKNFCESQKWIEQKGGTMEDGLDQFLKAEERLVRSLQPKKDEDYILCQELECPVCLTEMVPPVKIWTCKSGHLLCQSCKRNPNIRQKCPTCRESWENTNLPVRNRMAESMIPQYFRSSMNVSRNSMLEVEPEINFVSETKAFSTWFTGLILIRPVHYSSASGLRM